MVKNVRDKLAAFSLDNDNIWAACDDLRRQCHSQGVAFGDLSRLVRQSREDQEETRAYTQEETRPYPRIRPVILVLCILLGLLTALSYSDLVKSWRGSVAV